MTQSYEELKRIMKNKKLKNEIAKHIIARWRYLGISRYKKEDAINFFLNDEKTKINFVDLIEKRIFKVRNKLILDVGCGKGGVLASCVLRGGRAIGFDIDENEIKIAKLRIKCYTVNNMPMIVRADAEHIPFRNNSFDMVTCTSVLEHVKNPANVIKEMIRVTKVGGFVAITCPNPSFPREGHYKIFWIPYLPKKIGEIYLKLRGFNPNFFLEHIHYVPISKLERNLKLNGMNVLNLTEKIIKERFENPVPIKSELHRKVVSALKMLRLSVLAAKVIILFHLYPSVQIIGKKENL